MDPGKCKQEKSKSCGHKEKVKAFVLLHFFFVAAFVLHAQVNGTHTGTMKGDTRKAKWTFVRYQGMAEGHRTWGLGDWGRSNYGINVINGIRWPNYFLGFGFGYRVIDDISVQINKWDEAKMAPQKLVPLYFDNRIYFMNKKFSPYLALGLGRIIGSEFEILGAGAPSTREFFFNTAAGLNLKLSPHASLDLEIVYESYNIQFARYSYYSQYRYFKKRSVAMGIKFGITFTAP